MATNVPRPTFGPLGFVAPSQPAVLAGVQADINAALGGGVNPALETPQGQLATSESVVIGETYDQFVNLTNQVDPAYSEGRMQDAIGRIYFLERNPSQPTALQINCLGLAGTVIPVGAIIQDTGGNLYKCAGAQTIAESGTVEAAFACTVDGPIAVPDANDVSIYQAITGWDDVTVASGAEGVDVETRQAFEQRRRDSVAGNSFGPVGAVIGAVADVPDVLDYYGYNNSTAGTVVVGGVSIAAHAIYIAVAGGTDAAVGAAIFSKKGPGAPMVGDTTVTVYDDNPLYAAPIAYEVTFERPTDLQVLFDVTIVNGPEVPSDAATQIEAALISAFGGNFTNLKKARIGSTLYGVSYVAPIAALGPWAQVTAIGIGSENSPAADIYGHVSGSTLTVTNVVSGVLAVGQTLFDVNGLMVNGTEITALVSGTGGVGTYTVNNPQTVGGATFAGTGSGTHLTAATVHGTLSVGDLVSGTGVPAGTVLLEQLSGTAGGAGVYLTNNSTTSSGQTLTANSHIRAVAADDDLVIVQIDQIPQLSAPNITVRLL